MVRVIEAKEVPTKRIKCDSCNSILEYSNVDLEYRVPLTTYECYKPISNYVFKCPVCGVLVRAPWIKIPE